MVRDERPDPRRTVAVLRREWLRPSETFVSDHVRSFQRWTPVTGAFLRVPDPLLEPDCHVLPGTGAGELAYRYTPRPWWARRLVRQLARRRPTLMHVHFGIDAWHLLEVQAALGTPMFVTFHGYDVSATGRPGLANYFAQIDRVFTAAHRLVAVSGFVADRLRELGAPADKVVVHPNGVRLDRFTPKAAGDAAAGSGELSVLFVGRLVGKKGVADLIEAVSMLPERHRHVRVDVVGDGPLAAELRTHAFRSGLDVRFHAFADHRRVVEMMRAATLVCIPSRRAPDGDSEGLPTVAVEAAACAVPVVATRHAGLPEIVVDGQTGLLVPEADPRALAQALTAVLDDPHRREAMGQSARRRVEAAFDLRRQVAGLEYMYDDALGLPS